MVHWTPVRGFVMLAPLTFAPFFRTSVVYKPRSHIAVTVCRLDVRRGGRNVHRRRGNIARTADLNPERNVLRARLRCCKSQSCTSNCQTAKDLRLA